MRKTLLDLLKFSINPTHRLIKISRSYRSRRYQSRALNLDNATLANLDGHTQIDVLVIHIPFRTRRSRNIYQSLHLKSTLSNYTNTTIRCGVCTKLDLALFSWRVILGAAQRAWENVLEGTLVISIGAITINWKFNGCILDVNYMNQIRSGNFILLSINLKFPARKFFIFARCSSHYNNVEFYCW